LNLFENLATLPLIRRTMASANFRCGFCGKALPNASALNKHIKRTVACNKASHQEFGTYVANIWNAPQAPAAGLSGFSSEPAPEMVGPPMPEVIQGDSETSEPDDQLDQDLEAILDIPEPPAPSPPPQAPSTNPYRTTIEEIPDEDAHSKSHIEYFPEDRKAGAGWGYDVPLFESIRREQEESGTSQWGPFNSKEEWELAEWLIRNVGQKQTDAFLKLSIVCLVSLTAVPAFTDGASNIDGKPNEALLQQQP
jgi:hypothetical protein